MAHKPNFKETVPKVPPAPSLGSLGKLWVGCDYTHYWAVVALRYLENPKNIILYYILLYYTKL